jgi:predicted DNA-binding protein
MTTAQPKTKERTTVYLPLELKQEMARAAEKAGQTKSIWVERLIASHIKTKAADQPDCSVE